MEAVRKVLCATDLSEPADEAIRQADALSRAYRAALVIYHAVPGPAGSSPRISLVPEPASSDLSTLQGRIVDALVERVTKLTGRPPSDFQTKVGEGAAYAAIVSRAEATGVDLIVVGAHGETGERRYALGGVAEKVMRYAHCPVLVARSHAQTGKILAATDFSDPAFPALAAAAEQARLRTARVTVVHSLDLPPISLARGQRGSERPLPVLPETAELRRNASDRISAALKRFGLDADAIVTDSSPAGDVPRIAEQLPAELVIVATSGRTGVSRVMLGSVAEAVARAALCSVLVMRLNTGAA